MNNSTPLCVVTGVGDGTGASIVKRFAASNYRVAMIARNETRLQNLVNEIENTYAYPCDVGDLENLNTTIKTIQQELGNPEVLVHNAVAASFQNFLESDPDDLEKNFRVNTTSLLYLARSLVPTMLENEKGAIVVTGNTAAYRGVPNYALFAPTKAAQRIFAESMARHLGPKGIHVSYVSIDAAIDTPWTRKPFYSNKPEEFFSKPDAIAEEVFHVAHQDRSTWTFDLTIRPYAEKW